MSEKITIRRVENGCDLFTPETHSVGATLQSDSGSGIITFPEHKKDELGNFNAAAREAFKKYIKDKDLTPKPKRKPYNGKIFIRCGDECFTLNNNHVYNVENGTIRNKVGDALFRPTFPYIFEGMSEDELSLAIDKFVYYGARYCCDHKDEVLPRHYTAYFVNE